MEKIKAHTELSDLGRRLNRLGVFPRQEDGRTVGSLSIKTNEGVWVTTTESDKAHLGEDDLVKVGIDGVPISSGTPSREVHIHTAVQQDPTILVVAHIHDELVLQHPNPDDPHVDYLVGASREEGETIARAMQDKPYLQIDGHGQVIKGPTSYAVLDLATSKHRAARNRFHIAMAPTYALAASFLLTLGGIVKSHQDRFGDCQTDQESIGTITYTCPTERGEIGSLRSWEGEQVQKNTNGSVSYTFWIGGSS